MRTFSYVDETEQFLSSENVRLLTRVFEEKGKQAFLMQMYGERLTVLLEKACLESAKSVSAPPERYQKALDTIREHFDIIRPTPGQICCIHRLLYAEEEPAETAAGALLRLAEAERGGEEKAGDQVNAIERMDQEHKGENAGEQGKEPAGVFKKKDYLITEQDEHGRDRLRFVPTPASVTEQAVGDLCRAWKLAETGEDWTQLIAIPMFILDFLSIHPFPDGNGAVAFLLQNLLLYRSGFYVGAYVSLEALTEERRRLYDEALQYSSIFWHEGTNSYEPYIMFFLELLCGAGERFARDAGEYTGGKRPAAGFFAALLRRIRR